jgi:hypothetical protein
MSTSVAVADVADWIKRVADAERQRDAARARLIELAARKDNLVARQGRRLLDDVRASVVRDAAAFRDEFAGDCSRDVAVDLGLSDGGFAVHKPKPSAVSLTVTASADSASLMCAYSFSPTEGMPPREDRIHIMFVDDGGETLRMKHNGTGKVFMSGDDLSEYLLVPVLTGRPR